MDGFCYNLYVDNKGFKRRRHVTLDEVKAEVGNMVLAQVKSYKDYIRSWFEGPSEKYVCGEHLPLTQEETSSYQRLLVTASPTEEELEYLGWYMLRHCLMGDMWHEHNGWDGVLKELREQGVDFLFGDLKAPDGTYYTS
jgi:hypothetical protein